MRLNKAASVITIIALISLTLAPMAPSEASAQYTVIYILEDGSIAVLPPDASPRIEKVSDNLYAFTGNIYGRIIVQRDNIVIDGAGFKLYGSDRGTWLYAGTGINITGRANITIRNVVLSFYEAAIYIERSANISVEFVSIENVYAGIYAIWSSNIVVRRSEFRNVDDRALWIDESDNASIIGSVFADVFRAVHIYNSTNISVMRNEVRGWEKTYYGIYLYRVRYSNVVGNIVEGRYGIYVFLSDNNAIYDNLFNNSYWNFAVVSGWNSWSTSPAEGKNILGGDKIGGNAYILASGDGYSQTCSDEDKDGFCDLPLSLDGTNRNVDMYPLKFTGYAAPPAGTATITITVTSKITETVTLISERTIPKTVTYYNLSTLTLTHTLTLRESVPITETAKETVIYVTTMPPGSVVVTETAILERRVIDIVPSLLSSIITILTLTWIAAFLLKRMAPKGS